MPYKDIAKRREAQKRYYYKNQDKYREKNKNRRKRLYIFVNELKSVPCFDCHQSYPVYVMDFDHRDPKEKISSVANLVREGWSKQKILKEMSKCDLICANCHRIRTHKRRYNAE